MAQQYSTFLASLRNYWPSEMPKLVSMGTTYDPVLFDINTVGASYDQKKAFFAAVVAAEKKGFVIKVTTDGIASKQ